MPSNQSGDENGSDIVSSVLNGSHFKLRPDAEKETILKNGRPLPKLNIVKRDGNRNCNRTFQSSWYDIHKWLCGSHTYNKLFCWPCLLMRPETSSWCSTGNDDMKRFTTLAMKHALCKSHLKAISEYDETLAKFGLPVEFADELTDKRKEEETISEESDPDEDLFNLYFKKKMKKLDNNTNQTNSNSMETSDKNDGPETSPVTKTKITFKTWKEMTKDNFPLSPSKYLENQKLYKWKRKIAKQELRNARLMGEKLKYEIEVLKAKTDYYKSMKEVSFKDSEQTENQVL